MRSQSCGGEILRRYEIAATRTLLRRLEAIVLGVVAAIGVTALSAEPAKAQLFARWDGGGSDDRWENPLNWSGDVVPDPAYHVLLSGGITPNLRIDARGSLAVNPNPPPPVIFNDPSLFIRSLNITTAHSFSLDGYLSGPPSGTTSLTLNTGNLVRQDVAGDERDHVLGVNVFLANDGLWQVSGAGELFVLSISEVGGPRTFTKTGTGTLEAELSVSGATNINEGVFRGPIRGAGRVTVAPTAVFQAIDLSRAPISLQGSNSVFGAAPLQVTEGRVAILVGQLTIANYPNISVATGGSLDVRGGVANNGDGSGFYKHGPGELILGGAGVGSIPVNVYGGQLTIEHDHALGTGSVNLINIGSVPVLNIAGGINFANPISLRRATISGQGRSRIASDITFVDNFPTDNTLHVAQANNSLEVAGNIIDSGVVGHRLTKTGAGRLVVNGTIAVSGGLDVAGGALFGSGQLSDVNVLERGRLGALRDANSGPSILRIEDLHFAAPTAELSIQIWGLTPGFGGYSQLLVGGNATLDGILSIGLASGLDANQSFRVIDVAGTLSGQFAGLDEGALVGNFGGRDLFITYAAGDGNDVELFTAPSVFAAADFDEDGDVDGDDLVQWRGDFGVNDFSDAEGDGDSDGADFLAWQRQLGSGAASGSSTGAVPEPRAMVLMGVALLYAGPRFRGGLRLARAGRQAMLTAPSGYSLN